MKKISELKYTESIKMLKKLIETNRALAELKGYSEIVPNKNILISAIALNEAKDSSAIENIITTHDELFEGMTKENKLKGNPKEVLNYKAALWKGYELIKKKGFISTNIIVEIQSIIESNHAGIRKQSGTKLINESTGKVVYTPPETEAEIREYLADLERYININDDIDSLIKLAIIHYQFEKIHPFYDGNGRTGRIINVLYLVLEGLIDLPILYLSKFIIENREDYYKLMREADETGDLDEWILYILSAVEKTSVDSLKILKNINKLVETTTIEINDKLPKVYSKKLVDILFFEFYTKIDNVASILGVTRKTASNYLNALVDNKILDVEVRGKDKLFINRKLVDLIKSI
ncbi:MAG: Fic family protein [Clostridia bacterium]|jgi:Fic family protein|nr:Fic family protein [Clostridia bacterium]